METTRVAGEGHTTPAKAASIIAGVVTEMARSRQLGFGQPLSLGTGLRAAPGGSSGRSGGGGGGGRAGAAGSSGRSAIRSVAQGLGSFLADVNEKGFREALAERGLTDLDGRSPQEIALALADVLGGPASLIDETAVRAALMDLVMEWCESDDAQEFDDLVSSAAENIESVLYKFFANYIFEVFKTVGAQNVIKTHGPDKADAMATQIRAFIRSKLGSVQCDRNLSGIDWTGADGASIIDEIVGHTIEVFGSEES